MKILFLTHRFSPDVGGIEVNSEILASAFHEAGHEVKVLTWTKEMGTKSFPFPVIRNPTRLTLIKQHIWADLIFENNICLRLSWPNFFFGKPIVVALCTWINRMDGSIGWQDKLKFWWLGRASRVIAVSEAVKSKCFSGAVVISNPYQVNLFQRMPKISPVFTFVFLGRLVSDKGADLAIEAINQLINSYELEGLIKDSITLTIIGDGPERAKLENMAKEYGIQHAVTFKGILRGGELVECLNNHKYILVPSLWEEPFGNVALEGMACGCLPIGSDGGGLPDAIGNAGLLFKRGDLKDFVSVIKVILENPEKESLIRENATAHLGKHNPAYIAKRYLDIINEACHLNS